MTISFRQVLCFAIASLVWAAPAAAQTRVAVRLSDEELVALIDRAKTSGEHEQLAAFYDQQAQAFERQALKARETASSSRTRPTPVFSKIPPTTSYVKLYEARAISAWRSAKEAALMADHHRMLAKAAADNFDR